MECVGVTVAAISRERVWAVGKEAAGRCAGGLAHACSRGFY
jgi:hypothetical protein